MMRVIKKIIKNFLLLSALFSFVLSTSGFVITRHICSHHSTEIVLGEVTEGCCAMEKEEVEPSCCSPKKTVINHVEDDCCQFDKNYIRLSENFVSSENDDFIKQIQVFSLFTLNEVISSTDEFSLPVRQSNNFALEKIPKPRKYLLFHQVKVEPPLI